MVDGEVVNAKLTFAFFRFSRDSHAILLAYLLFRTTPEKDSLPSVLVISQSSSAFAVNAI